MLTLPDTDQTLRQVSNDPTAGPVQQRITLPTPWLTTDDGAHQSSALNLSYQNSTQGWSVTVTAVTGGSASSPQRIQLDAPVALQPVAIEKPWGQEIWFSGIEQRGESSVRQGDAQLPLSHYLALAPQRLAQRAPPILLKILAPKAQAITGNLYFETHDTKREVYVVTHVDSTAWPDSKGAIRLGMNQTLRASYNSDEQFRAAYLAAVENYERIRRKIDDNHASSEIDELEESKLRQAMENFTAAVPLACGDVVQVAPGIPHSLQHGVRVFEFQTPTYERNIISFNQKVATQDHWDSRYAIANMSLAGPQAPTLETISDTEDVRVERIVDFDEFVVLRVILAANTLWPIHHQDDHQDSYAMLAIISGAASLTTKAGTVSLAADQSPAAFLPASATNAHIKTDQHPATLLLALPKPATAGTIPVA